jgi:hypothetical protein
LLPCCCIWLSGLGSQDLGFKTQTDRHWVSGPGRTHAHVGVMVADSRWSIIFVADSATKNAPRTSSDVTGSTIENAPRTSSNARTHRLSDFIYSIDRLEFSLKCCPVGFHSHSFLVLHLFLVVVGKVFQ